MTATLKEKNSTESVATVDRLAKGFTKLLRGGERLPAAFQLVITSARGILDDDNYESLDEKRFVMNSTMGEAKQGFARAIKHTLSCCGGVPPEVRCGYDRKIAQHTLMVRCNYCGCSLFLNETGVGTYHSGKLARKPIFGSARKNLGTIPITLRMARERAGFSEKRAAELLGIKIKRLRRYERYGGMRLDTARRMARLYELPLDHIYWGQEADYRNGGTHYAGA